MVDLLTLAGAYFTRPNERCSFLCVIQVIPLRFGTNKHSHECILELLIDYNTSKSIMQ